MPRHDHLFSYHPCRPPNTNQPPNPAQIPLAIWILSEPHMRADPIYATDPKANVMLLVGCGYFVFDLYICTTGFKTEGPGFLLHAVCCFTAFVYARASGFLHAYGA